MGEFIFTQFWMVWILRMLQTNVFLKLCPSLREWGTCRTSKCQKLRKLWHKTKHCNRNREGMESEGKDKKIRRNILPCPPSIWFHASVFNAKFNALIKIRGTNILFPFLFMQLFLIFKIYNVRVCKCQLRGASQK